MTTSRSASGQCPQCGKAVGAATAKWRPFCSERCKLADLGGWFAGRYSIPADPDPNPNPETTHEPVQRQ